MAVQLIFTSGRSRRGEWKWMARAIRSLPTPLSPASSTVARVGATRMMVAKTSCMAALRPTMLSKA
jgi:hypothetical protein